MLTLWNQFDDLFTDDFFKARRPLAKAFWPAVDIEETKDGYVLTADVPGMAPDEIDVDVDNGVLTLKGERKAEKRDDHDGYRRYERSYGAFRRSFVLPKGVDPARVEAQVENGQLHVRVPKPPAAVPRRIAVQGGQAVQGARAALPREESQPLAADKTGT